MLKLPKGLKKKKKGKKSKKDQELFTEEELEQYKREHQHQQHQETEELPAKTENDEEWSKFAALTTGVDSILKKTQGDLDRIKSTSFFQRVAPPIVNRPHRGEPSTEVKQEITEETEEEKEQQQNRDRVQELLNAVVELSESEEDSEAEDTAFDTSYTDRVETGELPLAYIPESPEEEFDLGPDPFDTAYADKVIKGPEVSKRGKKLVNIGAAVEVLTGKVETVSSTSRKRPQRRGPKNLLLQSFEEPDEAESSEKAEPEPEPAVTNLLDDTSDLPAEDIQIDLSVSLHLNLQQQKHQQEVTEEQEQDDLDEFDVLKNKDHESDDDEFAQLAQESLTKTEEITVLDASQIRAVTPEILENVPTDWAEFQVDKEAEQKGKAIFYYFCFTYRRLSFVIYLVDYLVIYPN
jgi:hypothetical protein